MLPHTLKYTRLLQSHKSKIMDKYPVASIGLFGSVTRDDFDDLHSDIDVVIQLNGDMDWSFFDLVAEIQTIFYPKNVDVVCETAIPLHYWEYVKNDVLYV